MYFVVLCFFLFFSSQVNTEEDLAVLAKQPVGSSRQKSLLGRRAGGKQEASRRQAGGKGERERQEAISQGGVRVRRSADAPRSP